MEIVYKFNDTLFKDYGVYVSGSDGLLGTPRRKEPEKYEFPNENGYVVDLKNKVYQARTIKLNCFIKSLSSTDLIDKYNAFTKIIQDITTTKTLSVTVGNKGLTFLCYVSDISEMKKTFTNGINVGLFTLTFIEPEPIVS